MIKHFFQKHRQFVLYGLIGGCCAAFDFLIYTILLYLFREKYVLVANAIGVLCGIIASFILNRQYNFKIKDHTTRRFIVFLCVGLAGLLLSSLLIYLFVDILGGNKFYAKLITIFLVAVFQFMLNRSVTFKYHES